MFDNWSEAKDAIANNDAIGGENLFSCGCVMIFRGPTKWESWILQVIPRTKYMRPTNGRNSPPPEVAAADFTTPPPRAATENRLLPKDTAVAALAGADIDDEQKRGMIITFESAPGKWADYRFIGTTLRHIPHARGVEEYGAKDTVRSVTVNGEKKTPDAGGDVSIIIDEMEVDDSFDPDGTNPVQNRVITQEGDRA